MDIRLSEIVGALSPTQPDSAPRTDESAALPQS